jgi:ferredoxin
MSLVKYGKIEAEAEVGRDLLGLLLDAGADISYICMAGSCGTCRVRVDAGREHLAEPTGSERMHLAQRLGEYRLACQAACLGTGDVTVSQPR